MRKLTLFILFTFITRLLSANQGLDCSHLLRAPNTDQQKIIIGSALHKYGINPNDFITLRVDDYISWKGQQIGCLANVFHEAKLVIEYKGETKQERCLINVMAHRFDDFLSQDSISTYSFSGYTNTCRQETQQESVTRYRCEQTRCTFDPQKDLFADMNDDCSCKTIFELVDHQDRTSDYEGFFTPGKFTQKP